MVMNRLFFNCYFKVGKTNSISVRVRLLSFETQDSVNWLGCVEISSPGTCLDDTWMKVEGDA